MSRNWIPALVAIGVGVFSGRYCPKCKKPGPFTNIRSFTAGYYTFQPLLKDLQMEKAGSQRYVALPTLRIARPSPRP